VGDERQLKPQRAEKIKPVTPGFRDQPRDIALKPALNDFATKACHGANCDQPERQKNRARAVDQYECHRAAPAFTLQRAKLALQFVT